MPIRTTCANDPPAASQTARRLSNTRRVWFSNPSTSVLAAKTEALGILSTAVAESINDRKQEGSEKLVLFLAEKLARKVKRVKPDAAVDPNAYTAANAEDEITKLLRLEENKDSLIAQARGFFAKGQLAAFLRDPVKVSRREALSGVCARVTERAWDHLTHSLPSRVYFLIACCSFLMMNENHLA